MKKNEKISLTREKLLDAAFLEVYKNGYNASSTTLILKSVNIPKGSMYHYFSSKKDLVLAVIKERIFPKMDEYFDFSYNEKKTVVKTIEDLYKKMSLNEMLIKNGCPLHRLIVEMSSVDTAFDSLLNSYYEKFVSNISALLDIAIKKNELQDFDTNTFAKFVINATWGALSLSPQASSKINFRKNTKIILELLEQKSNN